MLTTIFVGRVLSAWWIASGIWRSPEPIVIFPFRSMIFTSPTSRVVTPVFAISLHSLRLLLGLQVLPHRQHRTAAVRPGEAHVVHEGLDVEDSPTRRLELVLRSEGVGEVRRVEALPLVAHHDAELPVASQERHEDAFLGVLPVAVLDRVRDRLAQGDPDPVPVLARHAAM